MIMEWWKELKVEGWAGYRLATKLKFLKATIKEWAKTNFVDMGMQKAHLLEEIQNLDRKEELGQLACECQLNRMKKTLEKLDDPC